jgi:S-adenosylmethionine:tRNA ribosyltransferase-isomerase
MRKPEEIPIDKYDYMLPEERIAKYPLADRDASKILVYRPGTNGKKKVYQDPGSREQMQFTEFPEQPEKKHLPLNPEPIVQKQFFQEPELLGQKPLPQKPESLEKKPDSQVPELIEEKQFSQVPELLEKGDRLYFNATRVVQARLVFRKQTGARIEIFCLEPYMPADYQLAFSSTQPVEFICLVGNAKKWKEGKLTRLLEEKGPNVRERAGILGAKGAGEGQTATNGEIPAPEMESGSGKLEASADGAERVPVELLLTAEPAGRKDDKYIVRFSWNDPGTSFGEILERSGSTPIPPYLDREAEAQDAETYQTVYARQDGSVAAPTAGLHFTERVLAALDRKGVQRHELILHVGAGTFIPVKEENAVNHQMHAELVTVSRPLLESLLSGDRKIAVGTTTTRSLESIYWLGVKAISSEEFSFDNLFLDQWDAYGMEQGGTPDRSPVNKKEVPVSLDKTDRASVGKTEDPVPLGKTDRASVGKTEDPVPLEKAVRTLRNETDDAIPLEKAVRGLLEKMDETGLETFSFHTRLMITPGYRFRVIAGLFTNFHQPKSTLLLLIAAMAGDDWRKIYDFALENEFRFLSYGDSSLLFLE